MEHSAGGGAREKIARNRRGDGGGADDDDVDVAVNVNFMLTSLQGFVKIYIYI